MNLLVLGSGAREHALAVKLAQSPLAETVYLSPGNGGTQTIFPHFPVADFESLARSISDLQIGMVVIGPEQYLVDGLVDFLEARSDLQHLHIIGPNQACAALEGSKDFSKAIMQEAGIPTAPARTFRADQWEAAAMYISQHPLPVVIKADGLAAGKGVAVCTKTEEALDFAASILKDRVFGSDNASILVEAFLDGIEVSVFALCDGKNYQLLPEAKDYKRIFDGDQGPNTGGMGSVSPVPFAGPAFIKKVEDRVLKPLFETLQKRELFYKGFLFVGLMKVGDDPYVIEFNARLGDPETQTLLQRIDGDLLPALLSIKNQTLDQQPISISQNHVATVVVCAENYPDTPVKGDLIDLPPETDDASVYLAGAIGDGAQLRTSGGRVLSCTGSGQNPLAALKAAYGLVEKTRFRGMQFRTDIGQDLLAMQA